MESGPKSGIVTTEFLAIICMTFIAISAGFSAEAGLVSYHANLDLLSQLFTGLTVYIGGRTALKGVHAYSASKVPAAAPSPPTS